MSSKNNRGGVVYSTNPNFNPEHEEESQETLVPNEQQLKLHRETKGRGGKAVVIVRGFIGNEDDLIELGKKLKGHCGTGGSVKDGEIIIQGDQREKVSQFLISKGFKVKNIGG
ncbi:MAG: translation initiation factor [Salibacteraceae bacterium]|jgi:translation initiation factor 1|nr:translation initiation factor [Salibacteraceae bacterium]MDP4687228.1 translation initiation factor [Salibacteraceae bacterium]MDP4763382.1 translation initiation factor [Salibacteraceae bacterium]MDP4844239.1 translation initiation factor [Salibacteraceae bacterium]MDP4933480.1 translation initiation factor [Salibacteraceae bacterium]